MMYREVADNEGSRGRLYGSERHTVRRDRRRAPDWNEARAPRPTRLILNNAFFSKLKKRTRRSEAAQ